MLTKEQATDLVNGIHLKEDRNGFGELSSVEQTVSLISSLNYEVVLGGLLGFYSNSAGDRISETIDALNVINAEDAKAALVQSSALFLNESGYDGQDLRQDKLPSLITDLAEAEQLYDRQNPCLWDLLVDYVINTFSGAQCLRVQSPIGDAGMKLQNPTD